MSDPCSEKNPCNFPVSSGGYEPDFAIGELLFVSGCMALPTLLLTLAMAVRAMRKSNGFTFRTLLGAWVIPPTLWTAYFILEEFRMGGSTATLANYLFRGDGRRELLPSLFFVYLASFVAALIFYWAVMRRQTAEARTFE
jgi:hypothetical protein